jgi:hypothetical protein
MRSIRGALIASLAFAATSAMAQAVVEPGGVPADQSMALTNPDEYAWHVFFFLNRPAKSGTAGIADENRKFGDVAGNVSMVWETWALTSGQAASEVYKPNGSRPDDWDHLIPPPYQSELTIYGKEVMDCTSLVLRSM